MTLSMHDHGNCELCDELEARLAAQQQEIERLTRLNDYHQAECLKHQTRADAAEAALTRLRAALEFYADPLTYFAIGFTADTPCGPFAADVGATEYGRKPGAKARAALALVPPPEGRG